MAREEGVELDDTVGIGLSNAAKESLVQVGRIIVVTIALRLDSTVDTGSIRIPDICPDSDQGLAS